MLCGFVGAVFSWGALICGAELTEVFWGVGWLPLRSCWALRRMSFGFTPVRGAFSVDPEGGRLGLLELCEEETDWKLVWGSFGVGPEEPREVPDVLLVELVLSVFFRDLLSSVLLDVDTPVERVPLPELLWMDIVFPPCLTTG